VDACTSVCVRVNACASLRVYQCMSRTHALTLTLTLNLTQVHIFRTPTYRTAA